MKTEPNHGAFASQSENEIQEGLTKREYFAAMAMQGMIAFYGSESGEQDAYSIRDAVIYADKLIEQLNKEQ